ncbi:MAG: DMT family transporter [Candidatus Bipolaricaulaceae bacterium]
MSGLCRSQVSVAVGEVVTVAAIWSSSFVAVKFLLEYTGPFTVGGLRYFGAFLLLAPWLARAGWGRGLSKPLWGRLAVLGVAQYAVGNGALFAALKVLPATSGSLALCLVPVPVLLLGIAWLGERPRPRQLVGLTAAVGGSVLFFGPGLGNGTAWAIGLLVVALTAFAVFPVVAREVARGGAVGNLVLTGLPLGIGGGLLVVVGGLVEGVPRLPLSAWGVVLGLAAVNTVVAYLLFNHALRRLAAVEANVVLNLTPLGTALLAWAALGERLTGLQVAALCVVVVGVTLVQWRRRGR